MSTHHDEHGQDLSVLRQELDAARREVEVSRAQWAATELVGSLARRLRVDPWRPLPRPLVRAASGGLRALRARGGQAFPHRTVERSARRAGAMLGADGDPHVYLPYARVLRGEVAPLVAPSAGSSVGAMRVAILVPPFDFGSGGHAVVFQLGRELEQLGHRVSYWQDDPFAARAGMGDAALREAIARSFGAVAGTVHASLDGWSGADVVVATGWQTAYTAMTLEGCAARAYLVNDHEPDFYPASLESHYAAATYRLGLAPIVGGGGGWLAQQLQAHYGVAPVATYDYPVAEAFRERPIERRSDTLVVYGRETTPRRAVGLALMAVEELTRRRPELRVVLFGDRAAPATPFAYEHLGPIDPEELSWVYSQATVGLAFSLTHASLVPNDMMACGLPVVALEGYGTGVEHAASGLVELSPPDPFAIADAVERLLDDPVRREQLRVDGAAHMLARSWPEAGSRVEAGLRRALIEQSAPLTQPAVATAGKG